MNLELGGLFLFGDLGLALEQVVEIEVEQPAHARVCVEWLGGALQRRSKHSGDREVQRRAWTW